MPATDVVVLGAGIIGAATAWRCAQRGLRVTLVDPAPERGAWSTAAGMLAPVTELHYTETALLDLNLDSMRRYPNFVEELTAITGLDVGYRRTGALAVAWDAADLAHLRELQAFAARLGLSADLVGSRHLRELEPALAPGLPGGMLACDDHQVDPRRLHAALLAAGGAAGVTVLRCAASVLVERGEERISGVRTDDGAVVSAGQVVLAAGSWSAHVPGLPAQAVPPVRPVKGQTLRLRLPGALRLRHVLRATVKGSPVYVVPRADGQLIVGASTEEAGFDQKPRAGAVYELLRDAQSVVPELGEAIFEEVSTGLRPGSPDNAPIVGPSAVDGLIHATGHYRNGVLLTPVTADGVAELVADGTLPDVLRPFDAARFAAVAR